MQIIWPTPARLIPGGRHHAFLAEARELLRLAVPMAATQLAQMIVLATDTVMLGHLSKEALAAAALGNTVYFLAWLLGSGMPMAVSPVIAHVQGRHSAALKPRDRARSAHRRAHGPVVGCACLAAAARSFDIHPSHFAVAASGAAHGGECRDLHVGLGLGPALCAGLPGAAQLFHGAVARRTAACGDGRGDLCGMALAIMA